MSRKWDIGDDVFSTNDLITRPQTSSRRVVTEASSLLELVVVAGLMTGPAISATALMSSASLDVTSESRVVFQRSSIPLRRPPDREKRPGVDFARGRSAAKLANSFEGYFKPSTQIDDSSDEGYVFN